MGILQSAIHCSAHRRSSLFGRHRRSHVCQQQVRAWTPKGGSRAVHDAQCMKEGTAEDSIKAIVGNIITTNNAAAMMNRVERPNGEMADILVAVDEKGNKPNDCGVTGE